MQFQVPLPNWFSYNSTPNIYHLAELKNNFSRFIIMISTTESIRILEVNLGAITAELWKEKPALRQYFERELTKHQNQFHHKESTDNLITQKNSGSSDDDGGLESCHSERSEESIF